MKTTLMAQVTNSIFEVMETMFFMTLEELNASGSQRLPQPAGEMIASAISFSGKFSGTIFLEIPLHLLETMTENFMGQEMESLSREYTEGTLKEALNMVAGNALTRMDPSVYMGLGIPQIVPSPAPDGVDDTVILTSGRDILMAHVRLN